ncbi:MAG: hypothetical protein AB9M60_12525 [Leptothrix sp. (in: b-proteobacteria)]
MPLTPRPTPPTGAAEPAHAARHAQPRSLDPEAAAQSGPAPGPMRRTKPAAGAAEVDDVILSDAYRRAAARERATGESPADPTVWAEPALPETDAATQRQLQHAYDAAAEDEARRSEPARRSLPPAAPAGEPLNRPAGARRGAWLLRLSIGVAALALLLIGLALLRLWLRS